jgi:hypothetical protein
MLKSSIIEPTRRRKMMTRKQHSGAQSLNAIDGKIADAELNDVSGGDKKTTTTKPSTTPVKFMVYTMEQVLVSSY